MAPFFTGGQRSIPACAGEPCPSCPNCPRAGVYPRVCGGTFTCRWISRTPNGLSPRVRGNPASDAARRGASWSIPACAGEPCSCWPCWASRRVYPRVCGGTTISPAPRITLEGLSPRVRGNRAERRQPPHPERSIPACAGEPDTYPPATRSQRVYPRVCGGTSFCGSSGSRGGGLSPRVRGNPGQRRSVDQAAGSIPACAGEPGIRPCNAAGKRVYPRVCGGTDGNEIERRVNEGLSPRVRGNRVRPDGAAELDGSIPACAGEPITTTTTMTMPTVYPRVCGGTRVSQVLLRLQQGLSPRVRGNPVAVDPGVVVAGSIPACAGEPAARQRTALLFLVYPRVCGGTDTRYLMRKSGEGLSPRVRGNPKRTSPPLAMPGSIPACAGEPRVVVRPVNPPRVYPRVCGGTNSNPRWGSTDRGLSPRVRGNRGVGRTGDLPSGSIPACAGEPSNADALATTARVYPRVCGGTSPAPSAFRAGVGLSPRVRGNRRRNEPATESEGSIPACAGEPVVSMRRRGGTAVYPRVCGGTPAGVFLPANCPGLSPRVRGNRRGRRHRGAQ